MIDNWIRNRLEKQGLMVIPQSWARDYEDLVEAKQTLHQALRQIGGEYNALLKDYAELASEKKLKSDLKDSKIDTKGAKGQDLIDLYVQTYSIEFEDDIEEEIE